MTVEYAESLILHSAPFLTSHEKNTSHKKHITQKKDTNW